MTTVFKKARITLFVSLLSCISLAYGQAKQTYNGTYNSKNFHGTAVYQYSEDNSQQRIFDGSFAFESKAQNSTVSVIGNFHNNQKQGQWKAKLANVPHSDIVMKYIITATVAGSFNEGNLDGSWTLNRTKLVSFSNSGISTYYQSNINALSYLFDGKKLDFSKSSTIIEVAKVNFKDNHFAGDFSYSIGNNSKVTGQFDQDGYFNGVWTISYYDNGILFTEMRNYLNGILTTIKNKDNSTGDIRTVYDKTADVTAFFQSYDKATNLSVNGDKYYRISNRNSIYGERKFLSDAIAIWYTNSSLDMSSYVWEIPKGTNKMTVFPERTIELDEKKTDEAKEIADAKERELEQKKERELHEEREAKLAKENEERRQTQDAERKKYEFERSDYGKLKKEIKTSFIVWMEKKEFETQSDYKKRIEENANAEFNNIVQTKITASKQQFLKSIFSAALGEYDIEKEVFSLQLAQDYGSVSFQSPVYIDVPRALAENMKSKFGVSPRHGTPMLAFITDATIINNKWTTTKMIVVFPNQSSRNSANYNKPYYDENYWNYTHLEDNSKGGYTLAYASNINLKPCKLKDIHSQYNSSSLDDGLYFYEWQDHSDDKITFTMVDLGIELPKL